MRRPQTARPTTAASTRSRPDYSAAGEGGWVRQNYSAHVIPIVELPPRDAATWHVMNQRWLARSMRHRGTSVQERMRSENLRLDAAFFENKSDEQLRGHYGTPASGVVPRPLSARSTQSETQKWRIRGIRN